LTDLIKGVLGSAWSLAVGWILPTFLSLQLVAWLVAPSFSALPGVQVFLGMDYGARQATLLAIAAVVGLVLAAAKTQLYNPLEGYALWPHRLAEWSRNRHRARRAGWLREAEEVGTTGDDLRYGLLYRRASRYPIDDQQIAPTALGNAIRRFETYAADRYQLDSQLLWHHLQGAAPDRVAQAVDSARTNVDFFVCLVWGMVFSAVVAAATLVSGAQDRTSLIIAIVLGLVGSVSSYGLALVATDEWEAAVRAMVDHGRLAGVSWLF